jgi:hypothetical protein
MSSTTYFDTPFSFEKSIHVLDELCHRLTGDQSNDLVNHLRDRDWAYLAGYKPAGDPTVSTAVQYMQLAQIGAFFSKNASLPLNVDTKAVALQKFVESESKCEATNMAFRNRSLPFSQGGRDASLIFRVQRKIAGILGPLPRLTDLDFGFGPGANVGLSRFTSVRRKTSAAPTCSAGAWKYLSVLQECFPFWQELRNAVPCDYGKYASVPKNASTDRSILVEPLINSFLQAGVGACIRERLKRVGVNLRDQTINQERARKGSLTGDIATLDLKAASDTISREVVAELLPIDWWLLCEDLRSKFALMPDGRKIVLQKFSSMGNGFTFELESLIFYAICSVLSDERVTIYGDDITCASKDVHVIIAGLEHFGFSVNLEKSFWEGPFRESCGSDFFEGCMVRPVFVKGLLSVKELFRLHNFFVRNHEEGLAEVCLRHIPHRFLVWGPDGFGDGHLIGDHQRTRPRRISRSGWGGYVFRTFQTVPIERREPLGGDYAAFLYLSTSSKALEHHVISSGQHRGKLHVVDTPEPSRTMYHERGTGRYRLQSVYTLNLT